MPRSRLADVCSHDWNVQQDVANTRVVQGAIDWLEKNQDKTIEEIQSASSANTGAASAEGGEAKSLKCKECGKLFRNQVSAEAHAEKTEHVDFEESTEEIAPLTEEQKAAKLQELKDRLAAKRAGQAAQDKIEQKKNAAILAKSTKDQQDAKEQLEIKQRIKDAEAKRKEKQDDLDAKKRIQAKIQADKEERKRKAEQEKAARMGQTFPTGPVEQSMPAGTSVPAPATSAPKPASAYTEARLRLQTPKGTIQKSFPAETTLFEVAHAIAQENGTNVQAFTSNFPRKTFDQSDFGMTLKEAGMVPSAALVVR